MDRDPEPESHAKEPELESLASGSALDLNPLLEWAVMPMKYALIINSLTFFEKGTSPLLYNVTHTRPFRVE